jgi:hypothetical protein
MADICLGKLVANAVVLPGCGKFTEQYLAGNMLQLCVSRRGLRPCKHISRRETTSAKFSSLLLKLVNTNAENIRRNLRSTNTAFAIKLLVVHAYRYLRANSYIMRPSTKLCNQQFQRSKIHQLRCWPITHTHHTSVLKSHDQKGKHVILTTVNMENTLQLTFLACAHRKDP